MENKSNEERLVNRRRALQVIGVGVTSASTLLIAGCKQEAKETEKAAGSAAKKAEKKAAEPAKEATAKKAGGADCSPPDDLPEAAKNLRKTLQYVEESPKEGKYCNNCMQWQAEKYDDPCGGCKLFEGPVAPKGYCLSYAPKQA